MTVDTSGTMTEAVYAQAPRAGKIYICATHPLLSGPACERLSKAPVEEIAVTNTVAIPDERKFEKLTVLSIAPLLAKAIGYTHGDLSVSSLFE